MKELYNVYCDESCHLENDNSTVMILGAMYCLADKKKEIYNDIRKIKEKHGVSTFFEIKWTPKVRLLCRTMCSLMNCIKSLVFIPIMSL